MNVTTTFKHDKFLAIQTCKSFSQLPLKKIVCELPAKVGQTIIEQCLRVIQLGGVLIICASLHLNDFPEMAPICHNFYTVYHEPYYRHYTTDNLIERLEKAGFENIEMQVHFFSKYFIGQKPTEVT